MSASSRSTTHLSIFNRQVLMSQDDAFTLAWYLLGDETQAEAVVQAAVECLFRHHTAGEKSFRLMFMQAVVKQALGRLRSPLPLMGKTGEESIQDLLHRLPGVDRLALILVDILNLSYAETAEVMRMPVKDLGPRLTWARRRLAGSQPQPEPSLLVQSHEKV